MVDIIVGAIPPVQNRTDQRDKRRGSPSKKKKTTREKRQSETDRRESVRDGVVVTLSYKRKKERRSGLDRRKKKGPAMLYRPSGEAGE